jgi:thiamine-phosphate pyrophosphorylase
VVQIWDHWYVQKNKVAKTDLMADICHQHGVPCLVNNDWELFCNSKADGLHFDSIPENFKERRGILKPDTILGITCGNDLSVVQWAEGHHFDYISFCSMFPSASAGACEIVSPETVKKARQLTQMPVFLAGGINPGNLMQLEGIGFDGIAVISGILSAPDVERATLDLYKPLQKILKK